VRLRWGGRNWLAQGQAADLQGFVPEQAARRFPGGTGRSLGI